VATPTRKVLRGVGIQVYRRVGLTRVDEDYFESGLE
jgi:hypothetical protein